MHRLILAALLSLGLAASAGFGAVPTHADVTCRTLHGIEKCAGTAAAYPPSPPPLCRPHTPVC